MSLCEEIIIYIPAPSGLGQPYVSNALRRAGVRITIFGGNLTPLFNIAYHRRDPRVIRVRIFK